MKIIKGNIDVAREIYIHKEKNWLDLCSFCSVKPSEIWIFFEGGTGFKRSRCSRCFDYCAIDADWIVVTDNPKILANLMLDI